MATDHAAASQTHFARRATGFVRDVKVSDAVIFNVLPACPGLVMAVSIFWVLTAFSGVNVYACIVITVVCSFLISGAFGLLSQIMPRSGADYILVSRSAASGSRRRLEHPDRCVLDPRARLLGRVLGQDLPRPDADDGRCRRRLARVAVLGRHHRLQALGHARRLRRDRAARPDHGLRHALHDARPVLAVRLGMGGFIVAAPDAAVTSSRSSSSSRTTTMRGPSRSRPTATTTSLARHKAGTDRAARRTGTTRSWHRGDHRLRRVGLVLDQPRR